MQKPSFSVHSHNIWGWPFLTGSTRLSGRQEAREWMKSRSCATENKVVIQRMRSLFDCFTELHSVTFWRLHTTAKWLIWYTRFMVINIPTPTQFEGRPPPHTSITWVYILFYTKKSLDLWKHWNYVCMVHCTTSSITKGLVSDTS